MKNSILYKIYLERLVPVMIIFSLLIYVISGNQDVYHSNLDSFMYIFGIAWSGVSSFFIIRSSKDYDFINTLPVTKKQQWISLYQAILTLIGIVYAQYIVYTCIRCHDINTGYAEIITSGVVKALAAVFVTTLLMWVFGHTDLRIHPVILIGSIVILVGAPFVGEYMQKAFELKGNNIAYELVNRWALMTVPYKMLNMEIESFGVDCYGDFTVEDKITTIVVYSVSAIILTVVLAVCACKNYANMNLAKYEKKGNIKNFNKVLAGVYVATVIMGMIGMGYKVVDEINVKTEHTWNGDYHIAAYREEKLFYTGECYSETRMDTLGLRIINIYRIDFPVAYRYGFIGGMVISVVGGCVAVIFSNRKNEVEK